MRRRQAKKVYWKYSRISADSALPPHRRNKWVRRYYVSLLKELDERHTEEFSTVKYYVYSKRNNTVRAVAPSQAMWENWNCARRFIKRTDLPGGAFVSTIFLQWGHGFSPGGPPVLFETIYRNAKGEWHEQDRDTSYNDAMVTHDRVVKEVTK